MKSNTESVSSSFAKLEPVEPKVIKVKERARITAKIQASEKQHRKPQALKDRSQAIRNKHKPGEERRLVQIEAAFRQWCTTMTYEVALCRLKPSDREHILKHVPISVISEDRKELFEKNTRKNLINKQILQLNEQRHKDEVALRKANLKAVKQDIISASYMDALSLVSDVPVPEYFEDLIDSEPIIDIDPAFSIIDLRETPNYSRELVDEIKNHPYTQYLITQLPLKEYSCEDIDDIIFTAESSPLFAQFNVPKALHKVFSKVLTPYLYSIWDHVENKDEHILLYDNRVEEHIINKCSMCRKFPQSFAQHPYTQGLDRNKQNLLWDELRDYDFPDTAEALHDIIVSVCCERIESGGNTICEEIITSYWSGDTEHLYCTYQELLQHISLGKCGVCDIDEWVNENTQNLPSLEELGYIRVNNQICEELKYPPMEEVENIPPVPRIVYEYISPSETFQRAGRLVVHTDYVAAPCEGQCRLVYHEGREVVVRLPKGRSPSKALLVVYDDNALGLKTSTQNFKIRGRPSFFRADNLRYDDFKQQLKVYRETFDSSFNYFGWLKELEQKRELTIRTIEERCIAQQQFQCTLIIEIDHSIKEFQSPVMPSKKAAKHYAAYEVRNRYRETFVTLDGILTTATEIERSGNMIDLHIENDKVPVYAVVGTPIPITSVPKFTTRKIDPMLSYAGEITIQDCQKAEEYVVDPVIVKMTKGKKPISYRFRNEDYVSFLNLDAQKNHRGYAKYTLEKNRHICEYQQIRYEGETKKRAAFGVWCVLNGYVPMDKMDLHTIRNEVPTQSVVKAELAIVRAKEISRDEDLTTIKTVEQNNELYTKASKGLEEVLVRGTSTISKLAALDQLHAVQCSCTCESVTIIEGSGANEHEQTWNVSTIRQLERFASRYKKHNHVPRRFPIVKWKWVDVIPTLDHICYLDTETCHKTLYQVYSPKYNVVYMSRVNNRSNRYKSWGVEKSVRTDNIQRRRADNSLMALSEAVPYGMDKRYTCSPWDIPIDCENEQVQQYMIRAYEYAALDAVSVYVADGGTPRPCGTMIIDDVDGIEYAKAFEQYTAGETVRVKTHADALTYCYCITMDGLESFNTEYATLGKLRWPMGKYEKYSSWKYGEDD